MKATSPSRFSRFLDTNYAPSSEERVEIESILRGPEERLRILDAEISKLQAEREELREHIDRHRMLLSPFRRLPADLWGEIFAQALPTNEYNLPGRTLKDAPLLLTTVCRTWRGIATRTPRLWNGIHIHLPRELPRMRRDQILSMLSARKEGVKAWLDRSGSLPITLSVVIGPSSAEASDPSMEIDASLASVSALFAQYSRRWKAIKLTHEFSDISPIVWQPFADLTPDDLPLLQDVRVDGELFTHSFPMPSEAVPTPVAHLLRRLAGLRRLHIYREPAGSVLGLQLNLASLIDLHITSLSDSDPPSLISKLVESCPSLSSLSLILVLDRPSQQQPSHPHVTTYLDWNFLRTLDIQLLEIYVPNTRTDLSDRLRETFRRLRTPALEHLAVAAIRHQASARSSYDGPNMPFHEMIVQSNCPITHLALDTFLFSNTQALLQTLEFLPSVRSLKLSDDARGRRPGQLVMPDGGGDDSLSLSATLLALCRPMSTCSNVEKLDLLGFKIAHIDAIIAFATAASNLKDLSVEFGTLDTAMVSETMFSKRVREVLVFLREVKGIRVVWKWQKDYLDFSTFDRPYTGMGPRTEAHYEFL